MEIRVLGPMDVVVGGNSLDLGGRRQRVVFAILALNANRVTPLGQLIDAVWSTDPPTTARTQIHTCISKLRRVLSDHGTTISTKPPGYVLEVSEDCLDVARFSLLLLNARAHVDDGDVLGATTALRAALDLCRGPALADVDSEAVQRKAVLLDDRRRAAVEERVRLDLTVGRHEEIIEELRSLVSEQPLREQLYEFLMLALYRSKRQAEALAVAREARTMLIEKVGIEPGQSLRRLEHAILTNDPALDLPAEQKRSTPDAERERSAPADLAPAMDQQNAPRQLPASIVDFAGRQAQITQIRQWLATTRDAAGHAMPIVAISGPGGVGKSVLAVRVAHEIREDYPDGQLYASLDDDLDPGGARQLGRFLRALGVSGSAIPDDPKERAEMYRTKLAEQRVLVVLDNVSDEYQICPLLPGSPTCTVITTSRRRLSELAGAHSVDIGVFDAEQSLEMLTQIVAPHRIAADQEASRRLVELCNGLPLALRIAGARLASRPHWRVVDLTQRLADETQLLDEFTHRHLELRSTMDLTYRSLPEAARRLFRLLTLVPAGDFAGWTAAPLLDIDTWQADEALESLVDARLVDTIEYPAEGAPRYRLHDLLRVYARERLGAEESDARQDAARTRLLEAWLQLAEHAHRRQYGGYHTTLRCGAAGWSFSDGTDAADRIVGNDVAFWWDTERRGVVAAIRCAAEAKLDELCWGLALLAVNLFEAKGYFEDWYEATQPALTAAEKAGNQTGQAAMLYSLGTLRLNQRRLEETAEPFRRALELFEAERHDHGRALVLRNSAHVDQLRGDHVEMYRKYTDARQTFHRIGDLVAESHVLCGLAKASIDAGEYDTARAQLNEAGRISRETHCPRLESQILHRFAELSFRVGDTNRSRQTLDDVLRIVRRHDDRIGEAYALELLGMVQVRDGEPDLARCSLSHALYIARRLGEPWIERRAQRALDDLEIRPT